MTALPLEPVSMEKIRRVELPLSATITVSRASLELKKPCQFASVKNGSRGGYGKI